jgi:uncharacterized membrane protein
MIEIIPNWHPIFVHFTIGLLSISALFYLVGAVLKKEQLLIVARWNLWIGALITIGTVLAGWYAYNTVNHDGPSHAAMTDHRNWALGTAAVFLVLALWALWKQRGAKTISLVFVAVILLAAGMLAVTGYKGGEVVYRHGLGVMRMPEMRGDDGHASHGHEGHEHGDHPKDAKPELEMPTQDKHDHEGHQH